MIEVVAAVGVILTFGGGMLLYGAYTSKSRPGTTKTIKFKFNNDEVYINLIEDEEGNRTMTHTCSAPWSKEYVYKRIEGSRTGIYNQMLKWISYDTNSYPEVSGVWGVSYE